MVNPPPTQLPPNTGGSAFTQRVGGLPIWGWGAIAMVAAAAFMLWRRGNASVDEGSDFSGLPEGFVAGSDEAEGLSEEQYQSLLALLRDLQGEDSVSPTPKPTTPSGSTVPRGYGWVQVKRGDSIASLAKRAKKTQAELWAYNGLGLNRLTVGEWIKIRSNANPSTGYNGK